VRAGSSRLPQKMLLPFFRNQSMFEILLERFSKETKNEIPLIVATTKSNQDDTIEEFCLKHNINCFRGAEHDVLLRFIEASRMYNFDYIIRVCADNPMFDIAGTLDLLNVDELSEMEYVGYKMENDLPTILSHLGFWGEVVSLDALVKAHRSATSLIFREHVTGYIYQNPDKFRVKLIAAPYDLGHREDIRLTVDTKADFELVQDIYAEFFQQKLSKNPVNLVQYLDRNPVYLEKMIKQIALNKK
jgi:spore coat polysaccharide biosynthesis protein SpsF